MYQPIHLSEHIYYVGVNDRRTQLFENMWPLPLGMAYNSYLINDDKVALMDTVEIGQVEKFLQKIKAVLGNRSIDYLVINHMEPDHAGSLRIIRQMYPQVQIVGNKKTLPMIEGFYGISDNLMEIKEGDVLDLGNHKLRFYMAPMVHWPETMMTYEEREKVLFSADAFGSFGALDGAVFDDEMDFQALRDEMRRYYSNIVGKYGGPVQKAIEKIESIEIKMIAATHGPIIRGHIPEVMELYRKWSSFQGQEGVVIAYASMYGYTEEMADTVARSLAEQGIKHIKMYDVSRTHASFIISDIFKYKGLVLASPTYSSGLHPNMEALVSKLSVIGIKNRELGILGSFTWAGAAAKRLGEFAEALKLNVIAPPVEEKHALKKQQYEACRALGVKMAARLRGIEGE